MLHFLFTLILKLLLAKKNYNFDEDCTLHPALKIYEKMKKYMFLEVLTTHLINQMTSATCPIKGCHTLTR